MRKLIEDLRIVMLGAAAGLFSSSVLVLINRIDTYYASLQELNNEDQFCYTSGYHELWWLPLTLWHVLLAVAASLLVHRYLTNRIRSPFLLWQAIGITTFVGWGLSVVLLVGLQCVIRGNLYPLERLANPSDLVDLAKYVSVLFAGNVFYGSVINASSRQYAEQFESD